MHFADLLAFLAQIDTQPAPPSWYYPLTADAWTRPREYRLHRTIPFDTQAAEAALRQTTLRLLKQFYAQELAEAGSEEALQTQKTAYRTQHQEQQESFLDMLQGTSTIKFKDREPTAEAEAAFAALAEPPEWFFSACPSSDIRSLWEPALATESWEEMDVRISEMEQVSRKQSFYREMEQAGGLAQLRELKVGQLQQTLEGRIWLFCHQEGK